MHGSVGWGWWMLVMMIPMLLLWGAIIFGVAWLIRGGTWPQPTQANTPVEKQSPVEILDRRFAEGAITLEDYQARHEVLVNGGSSRQAAAKQSRSEERRVGKEWRHRGEP